MTLVSRRCRVAAAQHLIHFDRQIADDCTSCLGVGTISLPAYEPDEFIRRYVRTNPMGYVIRLRSTIANLSLATYKQIMSPSPITHKYRSFVEQHYQAPTLSLFKSDAVCL